MLELESELRGEMLFASRKQSLSIQEISSHIWRRAHFPSIRRAHFSVRQYLEARAGLFAHTKVCATLVGVVLWLDHRLQGELTSHISWRGDFSLRPLLGDSS